MSQATDPHSDNQNAINRRGFLKTSSIAAGAAGLAALAPTSSAQAASWLSGFHSLISKKDVILFQGDSITDAGRARDKAEANNQTALGSGYAWNAAVATLANRPESELTIYNRGVGGNKVFQLADRWQHDCLDLKPSVLSILIGVNDFWQT